MSLKTSGFRRLAIQFGHISHFLRVLPLNKAAEALCNHVQPLGLMISLLNPAGFFHIFHQAKVVSRQPRLFQAVSSTK